MVSKNLEVFDVQSLSVILLGLLMMITRRNAVTQIVGKVAGKKLVERYKSAHNRKEVLVRLTERGEIAFRGHASRHAGCVQWLHILGREKTQ